MGNGAIGVKGGPKEARDIISSGRVRPNRAGDNRHSADRCGFCVL